ncbi:TAFII55 protein conserved region-domain-containing protein [Leucosporidium creatinivorum]|uniref:TAFII55 protein conserved region-domain-containing protein n=1 Tax=Leucosporidium creatinivorum TaxID=106004 RepID=A0A1Y2EM27_9BASI|nr:TAFII55 protein conserved region-domain-containing protein [Leucosporidium creatinivorum]
MEGGPSGPSRPRRQRKQKNYASDDDEFAGPAPKIKLKIGGGGGGGGDGGGGAAAADQSGIGWDRELDSDTEEPLAVEEQFMLRLPPDLAPKLKEMVEQRNVGPDVWFKFKDSRRAVFHLGNKLYGAKLVDLPALLESQKLTGSGGQSVKVADISQMLLVEEEVQEEADVTREKAFNIEDFIYPHGITPPLKHVRKRRFRKRVNKRTIEIVEQAVEKLLEKDARAEQVQYELLDHDVPSDDEYGSPGPGGARNGDNSSIGAPTPRREGSVSSAPGEGDDGMDQDGDQYDRDDEPEEEEGGSGYDSDLANEINKGMAALDASASEDESGSDVGGLFGGSSDDDDDDEEEQPANEDPETMEQRKRIKLLLEETGDLERAIQSKEAELAKAANPIFKKRFEEMIKKLSVERDLKRAQHSKAVAELDKQQQAGQAAANAAVAAQAAAGSAAAASSSTAPANAEASGSGAATDGDRMDES